MLKVLFAARLILNLGTQCAVYSALHIFKHPELALADGSTKIGNLREPYRAESEILSVFMLVNTRHFIMAMETQVYRIHLFIIYVQRFTHGRQMK